MSQVTNTYETYSAVGNREELADKIHQITPEETPFLSLVGRADQCRSHFRGGAVQRADEE